MGAARRVGEGVVARCADRREGLACGIQVGHVDADKRHRAAVAGDGGVGGQGAVGQGDRDGADGARKVHNRVAAVHHRGRVRQRAADIERVVPLQAMQVERVDLRRNNREGYEVRRRGAPSRSARCRRWPASRRRCRCAPFRQYPRCRCGCHSASQNPPRRPLPGFQRSAASAAHRPLWEADGR